MCEFCELVCVCTCLGFRFLLELLLFFILSTIKNVILLINKFKKKE